MRDLGTWFVYYVQPQQHYFCGIDLHTQMMYLCVFDQHGVIVLHKNIRTRPEAFLKAIALFRDSLGMACACIFCWYWLADLCQRENIDFVRQAKVHHPQAFYLVRSVPGMGKVLALTMRYESVSSEDAPSIMFTTANATMSFSL